MFSHLSGLQFDTRADCIRKLLETQKEQHKNISHNYIHYYKAYGFLEYTNKTRHVSLKIFFEKVMYALEIKPTALEATEGNCTYSLSKRSTTDIGFQYYWYRKGVVLTFWGILFWKGKPYSMAEKKKEPLQAASRPMKATTPISPMPNLTMLPQKPG